MSSLRTVVVLCFAASALSALVAGCGQEGPAGPEGPMGPPGRSARESADEDAGALLGAQLQDPGTVVSGARINAHDEHGDHVGGWRRPHVQILRGLVRLDARRTVYVDDRVRRRDALPADVDRAVVRR